LVLSRRITHYHQDQSVTEGEQKVLMMLGA